MEMTAYFCGRGSNSTVVTSLNSQVVLWTSCLLLSCTPAASAAEFSDSHSYLQREKVRRGVGFRMIVVPAGRGLP
jgi:hypothetical protein